MTNHIGNTETLQQTVAAGNEGQHGVMTAEQAKAELTARNLGHLAGVIIEVDHAGETQSDSFVGAIQKCGKGILRAVDGIKETVHDNLGDIMPEDVVAQKTIQSQSKWVAKMATADNSDETLKSVGLSEQEIQAFRTQNPKKKLK